MLPPSLIEVGCDQPRKRLGVLFIPWLGGEEPLEGALERDQDLEGEPYRHLRCEVGGGHRNEIVGCDFAAGFPDHTPMVPCPSGTSSSLLSRPRIDTRSRMVERKRVFSGLQPTGNIHVGNYLGALRNWVRLQDEYDCVYCIVDLHAITVDYDVAAFAKERREAAKVLIACGVDPARSLFYYQSQVPQHTELAWILGTFTGMGQLSRMTQFKDKSETKLVPTWGSSPIPS